MEIKGSKNRYYIQEVIAEGGYGYVYLGKDQEGKEVVIKSLEEYFGSHGHLFKKFNTPMHQEALRKEAKILKEMKGVRSAPEFIDFIEGDNKTGSALIMEYIRGAEIKKMLKSFIQDPRKKKEYVQFVQKIGHQVVESLDEIHRCGIIHNDIKPENIMYCADTESIKIIDYGVAHKVGEEVNEMMPKGTYGYIPPERFTSNQGDQKSDVFALGVTLEALMGLGAVPFGGVKSICESYVISLSGKSEFPSFEERLAFFNMYEGSVGIEEVKKNRSIIEQMVRSIYGESISILKESYDDTLEITEYVLKDEEQEKGKNKSLIMWEHEGEGYLFQNIFNPAYKAPTLIYGATEEKKADLLYSFLSVKKSIGKIRGDETVGTYKAIVSGALEVKEQISKYFLDMVKLTKYKEISKRVDSDRLEKISKTGHCLEIAEYCLSKLTMNNNTLLDRKYEVELLKAIQFWDNEKSGDDETKEKYLEEYQTMLGKIHALLTKNVAEVLEGDEYRRSEYIKSKLLAISYIGNSCYAKMKKAYMQRAAKEGEREDIQTIMVDSLSQSVIKSYEKLGKLFGSEQSMSNLLDVYIDAYRQDKSQIQQLYSNVLLQRKIAESKQPEVREWIYNEDDLQEHEEYKIIGYCETLRSFTEGKFEKSILEIEDAIIYMNNFANNHKGCVWSNYLNKKSQHYMTMVVESDIYRSTKAARDLLSSCKEIDYSCWLSRSLADQVELLKIHEDLAEQKMIREKMNEINSKYIYESEIKEQLERYKMDIGQYQKLEGAVEQCIEFAQQFKFTNQSMREYCKQLRQKIKVHGKDISTAENMSVYVTALGVGKYVHERMVEYNAAVKKQGKKLIMDMEKRGVVDRTYVVRYVRSFFSKSAVEALGKCIDERIENLNK